MEKAGAASSSASNREAIMANLDLPKKGASAKWSLEDDNDEDDSEVTNGNEVQESEEDDPLGKIITILSRKLWSLYSKTTIWG